MKRLFQSFALVLMATLALTGCKNDPKTPQTKNTDVVVAINLGDDLRAAISDLPDGRKKGDIAQLDQFDVYLLGSNGDILEAKRFVKNSTEYNELIKKTANGVAGGYKFLEVAGNPKSVAVMANYGGNILAKGKTLEDLTSTVLSVEESKALFLGAAELKSIGTEPKEPKPQAVDNNKQNVKAAVVTVKATINRFQIKKVKFGKVAWKEGARDKAKEWQKKWLETNKNQVTGLSNSEKRKKAEKAFADEVGTFDWNKEGDGAWTKKTEWDKYFQVIDVTKALRGTFLNRFNHKIDGNAKPYDLAWIFVHGDDRYNKTDGTYHADLYGKTYKKDDNKTWVDATSIASYYDVNLSDKLTNNKVIAFNYFYEGVTDYSKDSQDSPKIVFYFNSKPSDRGEGTYVSEDFQFVAIKGYTTDADLQTPLDVNKAKGTTLINLDLTKVKGGRGVLVEVGNDIPGVTPPGGGEEPEPTKKVNVVVEVQVEPWTEQEVYPVI